MVKIYIKYIKKEKTGIFLGKIVENIHYKLDKTALYYAAVRKKQKLYGIFDAVIYNICRKTCKEMYYEYLCLWSIKQKH